MSHWMCRCVFAELRFQIFDSLVVIFTEHLGQLICFDCHFIVSQGEQSLTVTVVTLYKNKKDDFFITAAVCSHSSHNNAQCCCSDKVLYTKAKHKVTSMVGGSIML